MLFGKNINCSPFTGKIQYHLFGYFLWKRANSLFCNAMIGRKNKNCWIIYGWFCCLLNKAYLVGYFFQFSQRTWWFCFLIYFFDDFVFYCFTWVFNVIF